MVFKTSMINLLGEFFIKIIKLLGSVQIPKKLFHLNDPKNKWVLEKEPIDASIGGFSNKIKDSFIIPYYHLAHNLEIFADDGSAAGGFGNARRDQNVLNILAYTKGLTVLQGDYTHQYPAILECNGENIPFYTTWHPSYVSEKTEVYHSRGDLSRYNHYDSCIRYKKDCQK